MSVIRREPVLIDLAEGSALALGQQSMHLNFPELG